MSLLFTAAADRAAIWRKVFASSAPQIDFRTDPDIGNVKDVKYLVAWKPAAELLKQATGLKVIFSIGAGLDHLNFHAINPSVKVVRMVQPGLTDGMVEFAVLSVLSVHRHWREYTADQRAAQWTPRRIQPAASRRIGILGMGVLGEAVARRLCLFGFDVRGWSRSPKTIERVQTFSGDAEKATFADGCDIIICLLPLTEATRDVLNAEFFSLLKPGATIINLGRGEHLVENDLLAALDLGQLGGAVLDVFTHEPLPKAHAFWGHPKIVMTPHIASMTHPESAAEMVIEQIARFERGEPMQYVFDRSRGY